MQKSTNLKWSALAFAGLVLSVLPARAQQPLPIDQVVTGVSSQSTPASAHHVMELMMRHGVLCRGVSIMHQPGATFLRDGFGPIAMSAADLGDLEIVAVTRCADEVNGPAVNVTVRNNSTRCVHGFHVSAVALRSSILPQCPAAITCVATLEAGECIDVNVCLPESAWDMARRGVEAFPLTRILIAIDSLDRFMESNESNNFQLLDFVTLPVQPVEVEMTAVEPEPAEEAVPQAPENPQSPVDPNALPKGFDLGRLGVDA
ncbi:MAG: hypothetical protein AAGD07_03180 [Planctomycetota bacterium]